MSNTVPPVPPLSDDEGYEGPDVEKSVDDDPGIGRDDLDSPRDSAEADRHAAERGEGR